MTGSPKPSDLSGRVESLEERRYADLPTAGLCTVFASLSNDGTIEWADADRRIARIDGERYRLTDNLLEVVFGR